MTQSSACPLPHCDGTIRVLGLADKSRTYFACDAMTTHHDYDIRLAFEREINADRDDLRSEMGAINRRLHPITWIRERVDEASRKRDDGITRSNRSGHHIPPSWSSGTTDGSSPGPGSFRGLTILNGRASSGKTWVAIASSIDAARLGWETHYLAAEGVAVVESRALLIAGNEGIPESWYSCEVPYGLTPNQFVEYVRESVVSERTLIVIDSISSLRDLLERDAVRYRDHWEEGRALERFLMQLRQFTSGAVSILVTSEVNASGETRGRSLDHKSDLSIAFESDANDPRIKNLRVVKSWWDSTIGPVGKYVLDPQSFRLTNISGANPGRFHEPTE